MPCIQTVTIIGYLGNDPEVRYTQKGNEMLNMSVAVTTRQFINGDWSDETDWWRIITMQNVQWLATNLHKGSMVAVTGNMQVQHFERNDGTDGYALAIPFGHVTPLSNYGENEPPKRGQQQRGQQRQNSGPPRQQRAGRDVVNRGRQQSRPANGNGNGNGGYAYQEPPEETLEDLPF